jgi:hypothetical protein
MSVLMVGARQPEDESRAGVVDMEVIGMEEVISVSTGAGDRDAEFTVFMEQSAPGLARTAWLLCGDEHRAEELVQQALMRTYVKGHEVLPRGGLGTCPVTVTKTAR